MKTVAKVFIWIGMMSTFYLIFPIIVGSYALNKLETAQKSDDLMAIGILSILFCSVIGGILILWIKDADLVEDSQKKAVLSENTGSVSVGSKTFTTIAFCVIMVLLFASVAFSVIAVIYHYGINFLPLIISALSLLLFVIIFILYGVNNRTFTFTIRTLLLFLMVVNLALGVLSVISNGILTYDLEQLVNKLKFINNYWVSWEFWVTFALAIANMLLYALAYIFNRKTAVEVSAQNNTEISEKKVNNNIEDELANAQKLFDNKMISEEEYQKIRTSIIGKYYK